MKKLVFFFMMFLTSITTYSQIKTTSYSDLDPDTEAGTQGNFNTFFGHGAGLVNTNYKNTFVGINAGTDNMSGKENVFIGAQAGDDNQSGVWNVLLGAYAGAGATQGSRNVFIGYEAGRNESGSNQLRIANNSARTLIEGDFAAETLTFNGAVGVGSDIPTGINIPDIQLFVDGRFSQLQEGMLGAFTANDKWSSLGDSPNGASSVYGMINQAYEATFVSGSKSDGNNIIGWSGNRLDFDIIGFMNQPITETAMFINDDGKVAIGDVTQTPGNYKLYVKDGILTEKVRVENCVDWADYVFDEDYDRNSTEEVEQFIQENKHLPNVPSAKEVSENGVDMVEMDATLLRQIEELWLHVIDLKKENELLKREVETFRK